MRNIIIFVLLLLIPITKVNGSCSYNEIVRLKKIASNINVSYDYIEKNSSVTFQITLNNLNEELYFIDLSNYKKYYYTKDEIKISNYKSGQTVKYAFYPAKSDCDEKSLHTIRIVLPTYNPYYKDDVCQGVENYSLCQKWSSHNLSYSNFVEKVNNYKSSLTVPVPPSIEEESNNVSYMQLFIQFLLDYYIVIIIILSLALIVILSLKKKDNIYS